MMSEIAATGSDYEGTSADSPQRGGKSITNVGQVERWVSMLGGAALTLYGLKRGSVTGTALAVLGGDLVYRGVTGHCHAYEALGLNSTGAT